MNTRYLRWTSPAEVLDFVQHNWPDVETFEQCKSIAGQIEVSSSDGEVPGLTRRADIAMPHHLGVQGGVPDMDAVPIQLSYTDEVGNLITDLVQPPRLQDNGEPYIHVNVGWSGTDEELFAAALAPIAAVVTPRRAFLKFAE